MGNDNGNTESAVTKRVVLKREKVLIVPEGIDSDVLKQAQDIIRKADKSAGSGLATEAWTVVGEYEGASKDKAIEAHAGKPGTPDAKAGVYKAPGVSAWSGGSVFEAPPAPLVQRRPLEDAVT